MGQAGRLGSHAHTRVSMATSVTFVRFPTDKAKRAKIEESKHPVCKSRYCVSLAAWYVPNRPNDELCDMCKEELEDNYHYALEEVELGEPEVYRLKDWDKAWQGVNQELLETVQPTPHAHVQL